MTEFDRKVLDNFPGKVVRKDLTSLMKKGANVPTYVLEYLLGMYCATDDEEAIETAKDLARLEGIMCGISSGTNVAAAKKLTKKLGKGKTVVTILPDTAERYFSTPLFENE